VADVGKRFKSVFGQYFELVASDDDEFQNIYYYRPPPKRGETAMKFADVLACAKGPLFIKLECTFKKPPPPLTVDLVRELQKDETTNQDFSSGRMHNEYQTTYVRFPVSNLPTSYSCTIHGMHYDFSPDAIGTSNSPVESTDGTTATLHMTYLTLPSSIGEQVNFSRGFEDFIDNAR
jgi:hypothetical protein